MRYVFPGNYEKPTYEEAEFAIKMMYPLCEDEDEFKCAICGGQAPVVCGPTLFLSGHR